MLFAIKYHPRPNRSEEGRRQVRRLFVAWEPPRGLDVQAHYHYVSGGGVIVVNADSPVPLFEALEAFKPMVKFDVEPVVNVIEAIAVSMDVEEWANAVLANDDAGG